MDKIAKFVKLKYWFIFIFLIITYIVVVFSFVLIKYNNFGYNCMDLGIFNQVFFNSSNGDLYQFTIHPHSYLGDHFIPFLILLLPIYVLFESPITLLFLQTVIIALCTIPIHLIAKHNLNKTWALIIPILWLINPIPINMNFFEFHMLPFAMFFLLFAVYYYQKEKFGLFILFIILSLSVREDVFLVIIMFSVLAFIQKKSLKWILYPALLSLIYFPITQIIISKHNPEGRIKFVPFYNWLGGNSIIEIVKNYIKHPIEVIFHIFLSSNMVMIISFLTPFFFLPIISPSFLILILLVFLQYALTENGGGRLVSQTHYAALFIPGLIASYIYSIKLIYSNKNKSKFINFLQNNREVLTIYILFANIFSLFLLSPIQIQNFNKIKYDKNVTKIKQEILNYIPKYESVASSYEFLPNLSNRKKLYSLNYVYSGYKQLSSIPYELPGDIEYVIINFEDILSYKIQYLEDDYEKYKNSYINWQNIFVKNNLSPIKVIDTYSLWKYDFNLDETTNKKYESVLYKIINTDQDIDIENKENIKINDEINFLGWNKIQISDINTIKNIDTQIIPLALYFQKDTNKNIDKDYQLKLKLSSKNIFRKKYEKIYPLTYGFYPTSHWKDNEIIKINYWFLVPSELKKEAYNIEINLVDTTGSLYLDNQKTFTKKYSRKNILEPTIKIDLE